MKLIREQFIVDGNGKRKKVILPLTEYKKLLNLLEDFADVNYAKKHKNDEGISIEEFMSQLKHEKLI